MTERETLLLGEFKENLDRLIQRCEKLKGENRQLAEEKIRLEEKILVIRNQNEDLAQKNEKLKFAKSLLASDEHSHDARIRINRIVREIDKCIALLNE